MTPPVRRLFFAFWPEDETRQALARACRKAVRGCGGRPVATGNLHATVAFLGSVPEATLAEVSAAASGLRADAFELVFDQIGHWPRPQVLVALCSEPPRAAAALAGALWKRLEPLDIQPDLRPYQPHVTLARKVRRPGRDLGMRPVRWPVAELALVESVTHPEGARYAVLARWPLVGEGLPCPPGSPPEPPPPADSSST
jgi:2'-5' RNA ligase